MTALVAGCQLGTAGGTGQAADSVTANAVAGDAIEVTALDASPGGEAAPLPLPAAGAETGAAGGTAPPQSAAPAPQAAVDAAAEPAPLPASIPDAPPPDAPPKPEAQLACEKRGGNWSSVGSGVLRTCVLPTRDAGKSCERESDCDGMCLARSRTCAPIEPLLGCNEILQDNGARVTLCVE